MPALPLGAAAPTTQSEPRSLALDIRDVSKRYGPRWALARLSYSLPLGTSLLLTGHNGSGKSTLLRVIATSASPTAGGLSVLGIDAVKDREEVRRQVALLSHSSFLYEDLSAEQNLLLLARLLGAAAPKDMVNALLVKVGLGTRARHAVRTFSAGMRKRLAIARVLLKRPKLVLLDEPFGELDPAGIAEMEKIIVEMQAKGTTVILATHLIEQGRALTQRRLHLREGRAVTA
ncbi:MAG: heme ABC exporter ATP-binding protein CcmA [Myxococcaceae bacterium]